MLFESQVLPRSAFFRDIMRLRVVIFTDVLGQRVGPILTLADGTDTLSRNVVKKITT
jgi:hypothetical protein